MPQLLDKLKFYHSSGVGCKLSCPYYQNVLQKSVLQHSLPTCFIVLGKSLGQMFLMPLGPKLNGIKLRVRFALLFCCNAGFNGGNFCCVMLGMKLVWLHVRFVRRFYVETELVYTDFLTVPIISVLNKAKIHLYVYFRKRIQKNRGSRTSSSFFNCFHL